MPESLFCFSFSLLIMLLSTFPSNNFAVSGPTPPAGRRVLPPDTDFSLQQVSEILSSKKGRKKSGQAPAPPRRTVSVIKEQEEVLVDKELKSKMKAQKAKIESSTIQEFPSNRDNFANSQDLSDFINAPRVPLQPPKHFESSQKSYQRGDNSKDGAKGTEDSGISRGNGSSDSLKALAIDKSKYLINSETATRSSDTMRGQDVRSSGRKFSYPMIKQEYKSAQDPGKPNKSVDKETSTTNESIQVSTSFRAKHSPKVPLPLPQHASLRQKRKERPLLHTSQSMDAESEEGITVGKLDVTNVTKSINRYGTIPKGVRIGEYLASMQQENESSRLHSLPALEDHDSGTDTASVSSCPPSQPNGIQHSTFAGTLASQLAGKHVSDDMDMGIQQESNIKPSTVVKSQSTNVIVENPKAQYSALQRQKSDLISGKSGNTSVDLQDARPGSGDGGGGDQRPKPSPRFSRFFLDQTENVLKLEETSDGLSHTSPPDRPSSAPRLIQTQKLHGHKDYSPSSTDSTLVSSPDSLVDSRGKQPDHKAPLRPPFLVKPRTPSTSEELPRETSSGAPIMTSSTTAVDTGDMSASVLSKVAMFQPNVGSEFSSFKPFVRGETVRDSFKDDKSPKVPPDVPIKPVPKDEKPAFGGLKPVSSASTPTGSRITDFTHADNGAPNQDGNHQEPVVVTKETILDASDRLKSCIDSLAAAGNKSSLNFMVLSEEVQSYYEMCSRFIDDLPPHAKFHTKELLSRLQNQQQNLKTFSSSSPTGGNQLLGDIQSLNKEIIDVLQR